jgi:hypothetical protein
MPFEIETQLQDQWCWAAVSASISGYYSPEDKWSQCKIASYVLAGNCCDDPGSFNKAAYLQEALRVIEKLRGIELRSLSFEDIQSELLRGNPIAVRIGWEGGGGHFVIIRGCRDKSGVQTVNIVDPFFADSIHRYDDFCNAYLGQGEWTDTFLVGPIESGPV